MPQAIKLRGAGLLYVVSIILIIFGAIMAASGAITMGSIQMLASLIGLDELGMQYFQVVGALALVTGVPNIVFGFFGVRFRNRADKVGFLLMSGIILVVIAVFATLYNQAIAPMGVKITEQSMEALTQMYGAAATSPSINIGVLSNNIVLIAIRFVLPALFVIGALLNRQSVNTIPGGADAPVQGAEQYAFGQGAELYAPVNDTEPYAPVQGTEPYAPVHDAEQYMSVQDADNILQAEEPDGRQQADEPYIFQVENTFDTPKTEAGRDEEQ